MPFEIHCFLVLAAGSAGSEYQKTMNLEGHSPSKPPKWLSQLSNLW